MGDAPQPLGRDFSLTSDDEARIEGGQGDPGLKEGLDGAFYLTFCPLEFLDASSLTLAGGS